MTSTIATDLLAKLSSHLRRRPSKEEVVRAFLESYSSRGIRESWWRGMLKEDAGELIEADELEHLYEQTVASFRPRWPSPFIELRKKIKEDKSGQN